MPATTSRPVPVIVIGSPKTTKVSAAAQRWIAEAKRRPDGAEALTRRAEWLADQLAILGRDGPTPEHLIGVTAGDLIAAETVLLAAARTDKAAA